MTSSSNESVRTKSSFRLSRPTLLPKSMLRSAWGHRVRVLAGSTVAVGTAGYAFDESNGQILSRSARVFYTGGKVLVDYRSNLKHVERGADEYKEQLKAFNLRTAMHLQHLCYQNGGIYTKFGQQLATFNHALPREFTDTLATLQDQAKAVSFAQAMRTVEQELQRPWQEVFTKIDETPIASASLAQVHDAVDYKGRRVAVKIQYPHLAQQTVADLVVIKWAYKLTEYFFPDVQISWIFPEFEAAMAAELDFENEKRNSRRIASLLKHNTAVHVLVVYDDLSSKRMLVMEYIEAPKISQISRIEEMQLDPKEVAHLLCEVFGEMMFCHGFVHCDPHPGNIFVRRNPDPNVANKTQLVLLDHGLYRELDEGFRQTYCDLWRGMILRDQKLVVDCAKRMNAGEFASYLPLLFTYRTVDSKAPLANSLSDDEKQKLTEDLKRLQFSDVTDFLQQLPRDMLFVFRTNNMIRSLNKDLGGSTRDRFATMGKFAVEGHSLYYASASSSSFSGQLQYWWDHASLIFHLSLVDWVLKAFSYFRGDNTKAHHAG